MPLIKTSELTGSALDWAVAKILGLNVYVPPFAEKPWLQIRNNLNRTVMCPSWSTDWEAGGLLLTQAKISRTIDHSGLWIAYWTDGYSEGAGSNKWMQCDKDELVAGLRCFVAMKLGNEIEIPEELCA